MNESLEKTLISTENSHDSVKHSNEVNDIITKVPVWIVRWGISLFFFILVFSSSILLIVKYPNTLKTTWSVIPIGQIDSVKAKEASKLVVVRVKSGQFVKKGQLIAITVSIDDKSKTDSLVSPMDGEIDFANINEPGMLLHSGDTLFFICPKKSHIIITIAIASRFKYMVKLGQHVRINLVGLSSQPSQSINGILSFITDEPDASGNFIGKFEPDTSTSTKHTIKTWMHGDADIVIENLSVADRIYRSLIILR